VSKFSEELINKFKDSLKPRSLEDLNKIRTADSKPTAGIWYYVYLGEWKLVCFPNSQYPSYSHMDVWQNYIAPQIKEFYSKDSEAINQLMYSMPRGRVDFDDTLNPPRFYLLYGNDIPSGLDAESEKAKIVSEFNLSGLMARGLAEFQIVGHEMMIDKHKNTLQNILGMPIPY